MIEAIMTKAQWGILLAVGLLALLAWQFSGSGLFKSAQIPPASLTAAVISGTKQSCEDAGGRLVYGWAWSSNIGWIHFGNNDDNRTYGLCFRPDDPNDPSNLGGLLSGFGWNNSIGWIKFAVDSSGAETLGARFDGPGSNNGAAAFGYFAQACTAFTNPSACSGALHEQRGGWDGKIALASNSAWSYTEPAAAGGDGKAHSGIYIHNNQIRGFAWGSDVAGWVKFAALYPADSNGCTGVCIAPSTLTAACSANGQSSNVTISPGGSVNWQATASGGTAPYTYAWQTAGGSPTSGSGSALSVVYNTPGTYSATTTVTDSSLPTAQKREARCSNQVIVVSAPQELEVSCSADKTTAIVNDPVTWTADVSGGVAPYSFLWSGEQVLNKTTNPVIVSYTTTGSKTASVRVTDKSSPTPQTAQTNCDGVVNVKDPPLPTTYSLTVLPGPNGKVNETSTGGVAVISDCRQNSGTCIKTGLVNGDQVVLTATPDSDYQVGTWTINDADGNCSPGSSSCTVTINDQNATVGVTFVFSSPGENFVLTASPSLIEVRPTSRNAPAYSNLEKITITNLSNSNIAVTLRVIGVPQKPAQCSACQDPITYFYLTRPSTDPPAIKANNLGSLDVSLAPGGTKDVWVSIYFPDRGEPDLAKTSPYSGINYYLTGRGTSKSDTTNSSNSNYFILRYIDSSITPQ